MGTFQGGSATTLSYAREVTEGRLKTLDVILLGLLGTGERTGYDVRKWLDRYGTYVGYSAQTSQIYRQLSRMVDLGWATTRPDPRDTGPDAKLYALTESGRRRLHAWVDAPYEPSRRPLDPDFALRMRFAGSASPQKALDLVRTELAFRRRQEQTKIPFDETILTGDVPGREGRWYQDFSLLFDERGHYMVRALIAWLEAAERRLEALSEGPA
jgi:DNA-binding PadR family transcriptional regulator